MKSKEQIEAEWLSHKADAKQAKKVSCIEWLDLHEIPWQSANRGVHIRVICFKDSIDIWPTTSKISINHSLSEDGTAKLIEVLNRFI